MLTALSGMWYIRNLYMMIDLLACILTAERSSANAVYCMSHKNCLGLSMGLFIQTINVFTISVVVIW